MPSTTTHHVIAARLPGGRLLIAQLDPHTPEHRSPLRRALRANRINIPLATRRDQPLETP
ncbi:hypothetical protein OG369_42795 [Streptomyces sp. NBC_01221]|uniref:hypothetical protein n=1 Tax=Streptomyces sp. NBC_01221 TaxID=2903782 RepID=UPI002255CCD8|nr:hypothetical protein [Streptomyces sp. NBC_01221]MCX4792507.1 hypothetical protein [Streptomyces sp. NBC_01221]